MTAVSTGEPNTGVTLRDILDQGRTLTETLDRVTSTGLRIGAQGRVLFTGCGASYHAASGAASLLAALTDADATAAPSSEVWLAPEIHLRPGTTVVALSRTGTTAEVIRVLELAGERGLRRVVISLGAEVPAYELADAHLALGHVVEVGRVMTQSFANLLLAAQALAVMASQRESARRYRAGLAETVAAVNDRLPGFDLAARSVAQQGSEHYVFCGGGPPAAVCSQAVLMMEEMTQLPSESAAGLEYRHGPIAALGSRSLLTIVSSPRSLPFDALLAQDTVTLGYEPLVLAPARSLPRFPTQAATVELPDGLPSWLYGNVALPFLQLLAYHRTVALGANPEAVRNLDRTAEPHVNPHVLPATLSVGSDGGT